MATDKPQKDPPTLASAHVFEIAGGYPVVRVLGAGGMGQVYACRDQALGRIVAVKVMLPERAKDADMVQRFLREARAMARVSSPHVVSIFHVGDGTAGEPPYIVMEFLDGEDLEARLARTNTIPLARTVDYVRDTAHGLRAASQAGLIHRDVKPANLIVVDGRVILTDFGLAKPVDGSADLTQKGLVAGSPHFMPPERARGQEEDFRADIYSLGATWFALLTGRPPFERANPVETIAAHIQEDPPSLRELAPGTPPSVEAVLRKMMAKDPARRFQSYDELIEALDKAGHEVDPSAPKPEPLPPRSAVHALEEGRGSLAERFGHVSARLSGVMTQAASSQRARLAAAVGVALLVGVGVAFAFTGESDDRLERIEQGAAREVLDEIATKPIGQRDATDDLLRGHAHAELGEVREALAAYESAAERGLVDERVLDFALSRLEERKAKTAIKLLVAWPNERATDKLLAKLDDPGWWPRHHALRILEQRGEDGPVDRVRIALVDLEKGPNCGARRYGLRILKDIGKGEDVLKAIDAAKQRKGNRCMQKEISGVRAAVAKRS